MSSLSDIACWLAVAGLVKDVFESAAGQDAVGAVSDYLRTQRVTSLPDLQVCHAHNQYTIVLQILVAMWFCLLPFSKLTSIDNRKYEPTFSLTLANYR